MSPSDRRPVRFRMLQAKMEEQPVEYLGNPKDISGDPVLPGFILNIAEIWNE